MNYIQRKDYDTRQLEIVDEFSTYKEARAMLIEYRLADIGARYYISQRACKDWRESNE